VGCMPYLYYPPPAVQDIRIPLKGTVSQKHEESYFFHLQYRKLPIIVRSSLFRFSAKLDNNLKYLTVDCL
jgi:hypothetical protein